MEVLGFLLGMLMIVFIIFGFLQVPSWMYLVALLMYLIGGIVYCVVASSEENSDDGFKIF